MTETKESLSDTVLGGAVQHGTVICKALTRHAGHRRCGICVEKKIILVKACGCSGKMKTDVWNVC